MVLKNFIKRFISYSKAINTLCTVILHSVTVCRKSEVLVKVCGPHPENTLFLVHEVFESLIAESFNGVHYDYFIPCMDCVKDVSLYSMLLLHICGFIFSGCFLQSERLCGTFFSKSLKILLL